MNVIIMDRESIEELATKQFSSNTSVISITDANWSFANLKYKPDNLLQIAFDDVDNDIFEDATTPDEKEYIEQRYNLITDEQASEIAKFYHSVKDSTDIIICQCEHGQSRSAAIGAAILEYESKSGITIFADDKYYPNKVVFRKVYNSLANSISH